MDFEKDLENLPALPQIAVKLNELLASPLSHGEEISKLLAQDQALTLKILKLANSSYYAIPGGAKDVDKAISYLGFQTVSQLVLGISIVSLFQDHGKTSLKFSEFWKHNLMTALFCETFSKKVKAKYSREAFTCGLLHDLGKLVSIEIYPKEFEKTYQKAKASQSSYFEAESASQELPKHTEMGAKVAKLWNLPSVIQNVIFYHHELDLEKLDLSEDEKMILYLVQWSNECARVSEQGHSGNFSQKDLSLPTWTKSPFKKEDYKTYQKDIQTTIQNSGAIFDAFR